MDKKRKMLETVLDVRMGALGLEYYNVKTGETMFNKEAIAPEYLDVVLAAFVSYHTLGIINNWNIDSFDKINEMKNLTNTIVTTIEAGFDNG